MATYDARPLLDRVAKECGLTSYALAEAAEALLSAGLRDHALMLAELAKRQASLALAVTRAAHPTRPADPPE